MQGIGEQVKNIVYIDCPSCSYRHGPMSIGNADGIVGCPQEKGTYRKDSKSGKMEYFPHRYTESQLEKVRMQVLSLKNKVGY